MDIHMPVMGGNEAIRAILEINRSPDRGPYRASTL